MTKKELTEYKIYKEWENVDYILLGMVLCTIGSVIQIIESEIITDRIVAPLYIYENNIIGD